MSVIFQVAGEMEKKKPENKTLFSYFLIALLIFVQKLARAQKC